MAKDIRVAMLIGRFYPVQGGAEIQCLRLSKQLKKANLSVSILTQALLSLKYKEIIEGIPVYRFGMPWKNKLGSLTYFIHGFLWLCLNIGHFDILHAHLASFPAILAGTISIIFNKPVILKFGGSRSTGDIATSRATWYGKIKLAFLNKSITCFICPSSEIENELLRSGFQKQNIQIISNGIDTDVFRPADFQEKTKIRKNINLAQENRIFVYAGRLVKGKGMDILLEAWKKLSEGHDVSKLSLIIIGSGPIERTLKNEYGNLKSVIFCGWRQNVSEYLRASDIFVLPSFGEGIPNSLIEAMSCGLVCVSTNIGGINELIKNKENGILLTPGDTRGLYETIRNLATNPTYYDGMGGQARKFAVQNLSIETAAEKYRNIYRKVLQQN